MLKIHVKSHDHVTNISDTISFYCNRGDCQKSFSRKGHLDEHLRHHDNQLLTCYYCPWGGTKYAGFSVHMNHHFHVKPFPCHLCGISFFRKQARQQHDESFHEKILDRYKCEYCDYKTHRHSNLFTHKVKNHPKTN